MKLRQKFGGNITEEPAGNRTKIETGGKYPARQPGAKRDRGRYCFDDDQDTEQIPAGLIPGLVAHQNLLNKLVAVAKNLGKDKTDYSNQEPTKKWLEQLWYLQRGKTILDAKMCFDKKCS